ncbi:MAG: DJ-1 family glyoxalase III [Bacilli bacterium]
MIGLVILANGFEDTEALTTIDVLKRAKIDVTTATINEDLEVVSQYGHVIKANALLRKVNFNDFDFLVIPGGKAVYNHLLNNNEVHDCVMNFYNSKKLIAAICAGPMVLGKLGILKNLEYTCFPGCEDAIEGLKVDKNVVVTEMIITGRSMYYSIEFALEIVNKLLDNNTKDSILKSIKGIA